MRIIVFRVNSKAHNRDGKLITNTNQYTFSSYYFNAITQYAIDDMKKKDLLQANHYTKEHDIAQ